jgi:26S proteasome non-ATPase regulatory subunit 9
MGFMLPSPTNPREHARALMSQKENIEAELDAQFSILKANNIDMTTPLVDREGFPRADVDLYAIRHARKRINELRNDYKAVMNEIETALQAVYDPSTIGSLPAASQEVAQHASLTDNAEPLVAFARVDGVAPSSPAAEAVRWYKARFKDDHSTEFHLQGLRREDLILKFGSLARSSFTANSLQPLADLVSVNENVGSGHFSRTAYLLTFISVSFKSSYQGPRKSCH